MYQYQSKAGYYGAISTIILSFTLIYLKKKLFIDNISSTYLFIMLGIVFTIMLVSEWILKQKYNKKTSYTIQYKAISNSNIYILKSTIIRFIALFLPFILFYLLIQNHQYFTKNRLFIPTIEFFDYLLYIFSILGIPYIYLTLKYRGDKKYEFGDYAILTIIGIKSLYKSFFNKHYTHNFHHNRRVKKVWLLYLVIYFFLTLMVRFMIVEFHGFENEIIKFFSNSYDRLDWYQQYKVWFLILFHMIFTIDVTIAIIGYSFASRWLGNRTKSVDATFSGWIVAVMCYPPFNYITGQFIGYQGLDTHALITNEYLLAIILTIIIILYSIYVWATVSLGFKFSNLTNRGIVSIGPYKYVRHPAYISKNLSWWIDNTFVFTNIWASIAMALWNMIYITRALTEERHLKQDKEYIKYCQKVKYRFIPKII